MFTARTARQWGDRRLKIGVAVAVASAEAALLTAPLLLLAAAVAGSAALVAAVAALPDDDTGHRGGAEGYDGPHCENTVEAALALLEREAREGPLPRFPYLEFDVQETADGELVVFHDSLLTRAFPAGSANAAAIEQLEAGTGAPFSLLTVQDLTAAQLQSLALGGRAGVHVPTLQQFLDACDAAGARRSLAVEIKVLRTDAARQRFIDAVASFRRRAKARLDGSAGAALPSCRQLGWAGVISFPHHFAACFGEYGSAEWARWAAEFRAHGIPVRACHCLFLSLVG
ncbi:glycerophosphodiester phosphodiesterase [Micractinium conductrix]|uniref:glycerophosphodiester phosphodiesterase n=1 Tax=Micractinium conductrix TaxID=554055 RepID=A0A2P6V9Y4_9CHLO|nr:glycerophosphodiester phosphodiesterase [Micractinium conductrix]|eukprot:PSC70906.1 glycerophosphodiester phosphodiesterase [Micractinium conductrix]